MSVSSGVGLISGINTESIITQMANATRKSETIIQQRQTVLSNKSKAYDTLVAKLTALQDQLKTMLNPSDFSFSSASSSDSDVLGITADKTAAVGSYSVKVLQLAQASRLASQGMANLDGPIASADGLVTLQTGQGTVRNYNVTATTTLTDLRDSINADSSSGVTASIINDGSATNPYRLVLTAKESGAANSITFLNNQTTLDFANKSIEAAVAATANQFNGTITSSGTYTGSGTTNVVVKVTQAGTVDGAGAAKFVVSLDGGQTFGTTVYSAQSTAQDISGGLGVQVAFGAGTTNFAVNDKFSIDAFDPTLSQAQDAAIMVDGIRISRSTNTFSDIATGVTFTAKSVSANTVTASVNAESGLLNAEVMKFQTAYNDLVKSFSDLSSYDATTKVAQPLFGESALRSIQNSLSSIITNPVGGANKTYNTLASLGMTLQADGTLKFDSAKMTAAMSDVNNIMKMFGRIGDTTNAQIKVATVGSKAVAGTYAVNITTAATRAQVDGAQALAATGLAANETLSFTVGGKTFNVALSAGDKIDGVVSKLNAEFASQGVDMQASNNGGVLRLQSKTYGASSTFSVVSDQASASANQLGIGTTTSTSTGADVAGTIGGVAAIGKGQTLSGATGDKFEGLSLTVSATAPTTASITVSSGVADQMLSQLTSYLDDKGIIKAKQSGYADSIKGMNDQIQKIEDHITSESTRMRAQFLAMEKALAKMQGLGDQVTKAVAQLQGTKSS